MGTIDRICAQFDDLNFLRLILIWHFALPANELEWSLARLSAREGPFDLIFGISHANVQPHCLIGSWEGDEARYERRREGDRYAS